MRNFLTTREDRYSERPANLDSVRCKDKIDKILDDPNGYKVTDEYNHDDVREILKKYFGIKCIYCEASPIATSTFRIDHFRPKKNVKEDLNHTGYYWLAYEWTNLMQSCQFCNGAKSNHFPLVTSASRVFKNTPNALHLDSRNPTISPLLDEQRLLLNPELDDVEQHFSFKSDGTISSHTDEGNKSIECYDLKRGDLIFSRKKIRDDCLYDIENALLNYESNIRTNTFIAQPVLFSFIEERLRKFLLAFRNREHFSLFYFYMFEKFEEFFISEILNPEHQKLLLECYYRYKNRPTV